MCRRSLVWGKSVEIWRFWVEFFRLIFFRFLLFPPCGNFFLRFFFPPSIRCLGLRFVYHLLFWFSVLLRLFWGNFSSVLLLVRFFSFRSSLWLGLRVLRFCQSFLTSVFLFFLSFLRFFCLWLKDVCFLLGFFLNFSSFWSLLGYSL